MAINQKAKEELDKLFATYEKKEQGILNKLSKQERIELGHPIKDIRRLDMFDANGTEYIVRTSLTIERFEEFEQLQIKAGFGVDFADLFANIKETYECLNSNRFGDASVNLYNIMAGIKQNLGARENPILQICALFICRKDEDVSKYDEALTTAKIEDWKREGINMDDFFSIAFSLVNGFTPAYKEVSAGISPLLKRVKGSLQNQNTAT